MSIYDKNKQHYLLCFSFLFFFFFDLCFKWVIYIKQLFYFPTLCGLHFTLWEKMDLAECHLASNQLYLHSPWICALHGGQNKSLPSLPGTNLFYRICVLRLESCSRLILFDQWRWIMKRKKKSLEKQQSKPQFLFYSIYMWLLFQVTVKVAKCFPLIAILSALFYIISLLPGSS